MAMTAQQPTPSRTYVSRLKDESGEYAEATAIVRTWESAGAMAACRLCPSCTGDPGARLCLILTRDQVADGDCALYSTVGRVRQP